ncbi:ferritin-like domain-containing protein [Myxococcota bacterium]|nr:ferritin-like domain-containing protein [Myxococcota bacterium]
MTAKTELGLNRTGIATSPQAATDMEKESLKRTPDAVRGEELAVVRMHYAKEDEPIGSLTPPTTFKGVAKTAVQALKGNHPTLLVDQLGARLAFERTGVRLYEGILSKFDAFGAWDGGPTRSELQLVCEDELVHMHTVRWAILKLGADPTLVTPAADVEDVSAEGLRQVIFDPRTTLFQCLHAIHVAELADNDAWSMLIALVEPVDAEIAAKFQECLLAEQRHLREVRTWALAGLGLGMADLSSMISGYSALTP